MNKILIVEDEYLISSWLEEALQDEGHTVLVASDADQAVTSLVLDEDIGLLFTDVDMPGSMNGMELASMVHDKARDRHHRSERQASTSSPATAKRCHVSSQAFPHGRGNGRHARRGALRPCVRGS